jgi:hypothetical protein
MKLLMFSFVFKTFFVYMVICEVLFQSTRNTDNDDPILEVFIID